MRPLLISSLVLAAGTLSAMDVDRSPRFGGQLMLGTAGVEPGAFAEFTFGREIHWRLRPEVFINKDADVGAGVSVLWHMDFEFVPDDHQLWFGARAVEHNADRWGLEGDAIGIYNIPIGRDARHNIEIIAALGFIEHDRPGDDDDELELGAWGGAAYAYQF